MRRGVFVLMLLASAVAAEAAAPSRLVLPPPAAMRLQSPAHTVISPSGKYLAFIATDSLGVDRLWVRSIAGTPARKLAGTEGARFPFWSPDDRSIGFFAKGKLKTIATDGSATHVLCDAKDARGGAWSPAGVIVFAPDDEGPIFRVSATGGTPTAITRTAAPLDTSDHREAAEEEHAAPGDRMPSFLPDGRHFLYQQYPDDEGLYRLMVGSVDGGESKPVLIGESKTPMLASSAAIYAAPGYLIFSRTQDLVAQKFDAGSLEVSGPELPLTTVTADPGVEGAPRVSVSNTGALAYCNQATYSVMEWFSKDNRSLGKLPVEPGPYEAVVAAPDSRRAVLVRFVASDDTDLWLANLQSGFASRLTHEKGMERAPRWSTDGWRVIFRSNRDGKWKTYSKAVDGTDTENIVTASTTQHLAKTVLPDGRELRLSPVPGRAAGQIVIKSWTSLLPR